MNTLFTLILVAIAAQAAAPVETLYQRNSEGWISVELFRVSGARVNSECRRGKDEAPCLALHAKKRRLPLPAPTTGPSGWAVNPASMKCIDAGGSSRILSDRGLVQSEFCAFSDGSLIDSGDL